MLMIEMEKFFEAIKNGQRSKIEEMIDREPTIVSAKNKSGATGILFALYAGRPELAELIAKRKSGLDIFEAASIGHISHVEVLIKENPRIVSEYSAEGFTALQLAAYIGKGDAVDFLLRSGEDVNAIAKNPTGYTALTGAVARGHHNIASTLLEHGANPNHRYEGGFTPLMEAAASGNVEVTRLLLAHGADRMTRMNGKTALDLALEKGQRDTAQLLK